MPAVQQKGVVAVYWDYHHRQYDSSNNMPNDSSSQSLAPALEYLQSVPIRYSALHIICAKTNTDATAPDSMVLTLGLNALPAYTRARTRVHQAMTFQELLMELREQFGLPDTFPIDENGKIRHGILNVWFHLHMAKEPLCANMNQVVVLEEGSEQVIIKDDEVDDGDGDMEASAMMMNYGPATAGFLMGNAFSGLIHQVLAQQSNTHQLIGGVSTQPQQPQRVSPDHSDKDVLLGRGRDIQNHIGNVRFRDFLILHQDEYDDAPRNQRREIACNLYNALKADGIRFLQKADNGGGWEEVSAVEGEKKIGQL